MSNDPSKAYDQTYFDRWYRGEDSSRGEEELRRQVSLAVAAAESVLSRPIESVLDVGAGEGRWQPVLRDIRPEAHYLGIEPSEWAVERFGTARNLRSGGLEDLAGFDFEDPFDLVICADVLHYLSKETVLLHLDELADLVGGVALLEVFAAEDPAAGDRDGFHQRPAAWYRRAFRGAGLIPIGLQMWVHADVAESLDALELPEGVAGATPL